MSSLPICNYRTNMYTLPINNYRTIFKLKAMLESEHIPFVFKDRSFERYLFYTLSYPVAHSKNGRVCTVIQGYCTYGSEKGLLETMGLLMPDEEKCRCALTVNDVFNRIKAHWDGIRGGVIT